jgi:hypothetical protein
MAGPQTYSHVTMLHRAPARCSWLLFFVLCFQLPAIGIAQAVPTSALETDLSNGANLGKAITYSSPASYTGSFSSYLNAGTSKLADVPGRFIYSDEPEDVSGFGILYQGTTTSGVLTRLYMYHVNANVAAGKLTAAVRNTGAAPATVSFSRRALNGPSGNYIAVGKQASESFYNSSALPATIVIPAGETALLDSSLEAISISTSQLLSSLHDFTSDQPLEITTLLLPVVTDTLATFAAQLFLADENTPKRQGTFDAIGRTRATPYTYNTTQGIRRFRVAENSAGTVDAALSGTDEEDGGTVSFAGNYGVGYTFDVDVTCGDGRNVGVVLNPRGGSYGGYVRVTTSSTAATGQMVTDISASGTVPSTTSAGVIARLIALPIGVTRRLTMELTPAGASSLPIEIHLVPYTGSAGTPLPVGLSSLFVD